MPAPSTFGKFTPGTEVATTFADRIQGKNVLITGGNPKGLGAATARALIPHKPATLIIAYRSPDKTLALIDELAALAPDTQVRGVMLDLANLDSIRAAAAEVNQMVDHLDLLINNAGVMSVQTRDLTNFGVEAHFGINHIGHFLFTNLILGLLRAAAARNPPGDTRIVNLSGGWYQFGPVRFDDYNWDGKPVPEDQEPDRARLAMFGCQTEGAFLPEAAYAQSKTANILFSVYLSQNLAKEGIYSFGVNPGGILTDIGRHLPKERADQIIASGLLDKTPDQGVSTTLVAALDPQINPTRGGVYLDDCRQEPLKPFAENPLLAERLWKLSEEIVGQSFTF